MALPSSLPAARKDSPFADMKGHHVAVRVADFEIGKRWYVDQLDFRVVYEWPFADQKVVYLAPANDDNFWVELLGGGTPPPAPRPAYADLGQSLGHAGYHHLCFTVTDIEATVAELRRRGVTIVAEPFTLEVIGRRLAFFADPWGNPIELAQILS